MNLDGEIVLTVEDFDEEGKALAVGKICPENFLSFLGPKLMKGEACIVGGSDDRLLILSIDEFP